MNFKKRVEHLYKYENKNNVLYLMERDQRIFDNYSVHIGYIVSEKLKTQFLIGCDFFHIKMNERQKNFGIQGLKKLEIDAKKFNLNFYIIKNLEKFIKENSVDCVILDFSPLRESLEKVDQIKKLAKKINFSLYRVDSHNFIPYRELDVYKRTGASVKINLYKKWNDYYEDLPELKKHQYNILKDIKNDFGEIKGVDFKYKGGYDTGMEKVNDFFKNKFYNYCKDRNNPDVSVSSDLSPWLHFGQISPQKVIFLANEKFIDKEPENLESFLN